jgi:ribonuclease P protein component
VSVATLRRRNEFQAVYRQGVKVSGRFVVVFGLLREVGECRFGITATRRLGGAVVRNRARRRIRELFRHHSEPLAALPIDVVVNARDGCGAAPWPDLSTDFERCVTTLRRRLPPRVS